MDGQYLPEGVHMYEVVHGPFNSEDLWDTGRNLIARILATSPADAFKDYAESFIDEAGDFYECMNQSIGEGCTFTCSIREVYESEYVPITKAALEKMSEAKNNSSKPEGLEAELTTPQ